MGILFLFSLFALHFSLYTIFMHQDSLLSWEIHEYKHQPKHNDWFWALGIITVASAVAAVLFSNYIFAVLIVVAGITLSLYAKRPPGLITVSITDDGIQVAHHFYPHVHTVSFWISQDEDGYRLLFMSDRIFMPLIAVPLQGVSREEVKALLAPKLKEALLTESRSHKIMDKLGF